MAGLAAAENVGMLLGPMLGGAIAAQLGLGSPFIALALLCFAGLLCVAWLPEAPRRKPDPAPGSPLPHPAAGIRWPLVWGLSARSWAAGFSIGMYDVIWALFMLSLGASVWQITFSWTVFAIPSIVLSGVTGRLINRFGAGRLAVWGAALSAGLTLYYAAARDPWFLIGVSLIEGFAVALSYPGQNALLVQVAPEHQRGRAIGGISSLRTIGAMVAALVVPSLFQVSPTDCFALAAAVLTVGAIGLGLSLLADEASQARRAASAPDPGAR